jgi:G:T-mismatch repair DNA endonuclease (very short patch repair protein)
MPDHLTPAQRARAMKRVKSKDGSLEKLVQQELRAKGLPEGKQAGSQRVAIAACLSSRRFGVTAPRESAALPFS